MSQTTIPESGMDFGPFDSEQVFRIEIAQARKRVERHGVKSVEFLLLRPQAAPTVWLVEAKHTLPPEDRLQDIEGKFADTFQMLFSALVGRLEVLREEMPEALRSLPVSDTRFVCVLVIKMARKDHLGPFQEKMKKRLRKTLSLWSISTDSLVVLDEQGARTRGLIATSPPPSA